MWVEETKNGYRLIERYKDPLTNKTRRASVKLEKNTKQAINKARLKLMNKIESNLDTSILYDDVTLEELFNEFEKIKLANAKTNTKRVFFTFKKAILKVIDRKMLIKNINNRQLNLIFNELGDNYRLNSLKIFKAHLNTLFKYAVDNNMIVENPIKNIILISKIPEKEKKLFLEKNEIKQVLKSAYEQSNIKMACLTEVLLFTGLRISESLNLTWEKVDFYNNLLIIDGEVKTKSSIRQIQMTRNVVDIFKFLKTQKTKNDKIFDFTSQSYSQFLKKLDFENNLHAHLFRHTHISMLAENGVNIKAIMKRVGHSDSQTTLKIYTHVTQKMEDDLIEKLENYL